MRLTMIIAMCCMMTAVSSATAEEGERKTAERSGREVVHKVRDAAKNVETAAYRVDYKGTGWLASRVPAINGKVWIGTPLQWDVERFRCEVQMTRPQSDEPVTVTTGCDGDDYYLIDPGAKTVYADMDPAVLGSQGRGVHFILLRELVEKDPFRELLEEEHTIELLGREEIGGVECIKVQVRPPSGGEATWFFGAEDFLPRRVIRTYANPRNADAPPGTTELTLFDLKVNPEFESNPFALLVPEGFARTDEFAP